MEARLLESLGQKLDELERNVDAYRRDLLADFHHHCRHILRDVPAETASAVRRALAASFAHYPALRPELEAAESPPPDRPSPAAFQTLVPPAVSGRPDELASPRERDQELQGLFTPSYLPLLEDAPPPPRSAITRASGIVPGALSTLVEQPAEASQGTGPGRLAGMEDPKEQPDDGAAAQIDAPSASAQPLSVPVFADDSARSIDDTRSSVSSDKSDSKPPRSALRRSSSMSKAPQSPRRVRFEFMGAEVLPTTSPRPSEFLTRRSSSPDADDENTAFSSNLCGDAADEEQAPPRKVSSSDALRALSRAPLEEGGVAWTVVNAGLHNQEEDEEDDDEEPIPAPSPPQTTSIPATDCNITNQKSPPVSRRHEVTQHVNTLIADEEDNDDDDSSDDGFLSMAKTRSSRPQQAQILSSPKSPLRSPRREKKMTVSTTIRQTPSPKTPLAGRGQEAPDTGDDDTEVEDDDDDLFFFEAGGSKGPPKPRPKSTSASRQENMDQPSEPEDEALEASASAAQQQTSTYATSPAVAIRQSWGPRSSATPQVKFRPGSVGSYKGQPLVMPVVRDPDVLAKASLVRSSDLLVDGIDGETAMQDGSPPRLRSTPFSFKERFMMEEMMERAKSKQNDDADEKR